MLGTDKIEAILDDIKEIVITAKLIQADGKFDLNDISHLVAMLPKISKYVEDFKAIGEAFEEGKDIDVSEAIDLIQKIHAKIKEIEAA